MGRALLLPTEALAQAIAGEWAAQGEHIQPATMPLMQLAATACDRMADHRVEIAQELLRFAQTELLCYRADAPADLVERQIAVWQPILDWAARDLDAPLLVTKGIAPIAQPADSLKALERAVSALDDFRLAAVSVATAAAGSLLLALALARGWLDPEQVFAAAELDASYQIERWGEDWEATERRASVRQDIAASGRMIGLLA